MPQQHKDSVKMQGRYERGRVSIPDSVAEKEDDRCQRTDGLFV